MESVTDIHGYGKKLKSQIEYLEKAEDLGNGWLKIVKKVRNPRSRMELLISPRNRDIILEFDRDYGAIRRLRPPRRVKYLEVLPRLAHELRVDFDERCGERGLRVLLLYSGPRILRGLSSSEDPQMDRPKPFSF